MDPRAVKKILVPTDFSEASGEALQTAIAFARAFDARIEVIHVFVEPTYVLPPPVEMATFPFDLGEVMAKVQTSLEAEVKRVEQAGIPVEGQTSVCFAGSTSPNNSFSSSTCNLRPPSRGCKDRSWRTSATRSSSSTVRAWRSLRRA